MTTQKFQNRIAKMMKSGEIIEVGRELGRIGAKEPLEANLLYQWAEVLLSAGIAPMQNIRNISSKCRLTLPERTILNSYFAVDYWLNEDWHALAKLIETSLGSAKSEVGGKELVNAQSHLKLIVRLFGFWIENSSQYVSHSPNKLIAIGDSHSLVPRGRTVDWFDRKVTIDSMPIRGIKMFHLTHAGPERFKVYFSERIKQLPADVDVLLSMGEIDCRPNEGIFFHSHQQSEIDVEEVLRNTIDQFVAFADNALKESKQKIRSIALLGVPSPAYDIESRLPAGANRNEFIQFIECANEFMKSSTQRVGWKFLNVFDATRQAGAVESEKVRLDDIHLSPLFYDQAEKWLLAP